MAALSKCRQHMKDVLYSLFLKCQKQISAVAVNDENTIRNKIHTHTSEEIQTYSGTHMKMYENKCIKMNKKTNHPTQNGVFRQS